MSFDFKAELRNRHSQLSEQKSLLEKEIDELSQVQGEWSGGNNELDFDDPKRQGFSFMARLIDQERAQKIAILSDVQYSLDNLQPLFDIYAAEDEAAAQAQAQAEPTPAEPTPEEAPPAEAPPAENTSTSKPRGRTRTKKTE